MKDKQKTMGSGEWGLRIADCGFNGWGENHGK